MSGVQAHVGGAAAAASERLGAEAYATGNSVAFRNEPDLFTAAHEAAHVVQQRQGVQLHGGLGQAGDAYEQHADTVAAAVVQGRNAEALLGGFAAGGAGNTAVQLWHAGDEKLNTEGKITRWPIKTEMGIQEAPNLVLSQYHDSYTPTIRLNIKHSPITVARGDLYVDFKGAVTKRVSVPNNEGEWQTPQNANVTKDMLTDPGKKNAFSIAKIFADYDAASLESGVDAQSPTVDINSYHDAFAGTGPEKSKTAAQVDVDHKIVITNVSSTVGATAIHESWSQQTAVSTSVTSNVSYNQTLSTGTTTGVAFGGKGAVGGSGQPGGELTFAGNKQWTKSETESYAATAGSGLSEASTDSRAFSVDITLPEGFKGAAVLYPYTQRRSDWVEMRKCDARGHINSGADGNEKAWVGYNIGAGSSFVLGVDPSYLAAFQKKFAECEALFHAMQLLERDLNAATGTQKEALGKQFETDRAKLGTMLTELMSLQPSPNASVADADAQMQKMAAPVPGTVTSTGANALLGQTTGIKAWFAYAYAPVVGK